MTVTLDTLTPEMVFSQSFVDFIDGEIENRHRIDTHEDITTTNSMFAVKTFVEEIIKSNIDTSSEALKTITFNAKGEERAIPLYMAMAEEPLLSAATAATNLYENLQIKEELSPNESGPDFLSTLVQNDRIARNPRPDESMHVAFDAFPMALRAYANELNKSKVNPVKIDIGQGPPRSPNFPG